MASFHDILVGVDLSQARGRDFAALSPITRTTVQTAIWLASQTSAHLLFISVLEISGEPLASPEVDDQVPGRRTVAEAANGVLAELARQAGIAGISARTKLVRGKAWVEIIRQVLREKHDLVMVGNRDLHGLKRIVFGSTSLKLLHECPCLVWVVKPGAAPRPSQILASSDLTSLSENVLRIAIDVGRAATAEVHVLHAVKYPLDPVFNTGQADSKATEYRHQVLEEAREKLQVQLDHVEHRTLSPALQMHLVEEIALPDLPILRFLQDHPIDLLVIGTQARSGFAGLMIGNAVERLLPEVHCSILAIKPADFETPVTVE